MPCYTARDGATADELDALCRATLLAQRERLRHLDVDVYSDEDWPDDLRWAVEELGERAFSQRSALAKRFGWSPGITVRLDPRADRDVELAAAVASRTISASGISEDGRLAWSTADTGTGLAFELLPEELERVTAALAARGMAPDLLVPMP